MTGSILEQWRGHMYRLVGSECMSEREAWL